MPALCTGMCTASSPGSCGPCPITLLFLRTYTRRHGIVGRRSRRPPLMDAMSASRHWQWSRLQSRSAPEVSFMPSVQPSVLDVVQRRFYTPSSFFPWVRRSVNCIGEIRRQSQGTFFTCLCDPGVTSLRTAIFDDFVSQTSLPGFILCWVLLCVDCSPSVL